MSFCLLLMAVLGTAAGCSGSSERGAVKGRVTVNGEPLKAGEISFVPAAAGGGPTAGAAIADGEYQIQASQGPFSGDYKVQIRAFRGTGKKTWDGMGEENAPASQKRYVEELEQFIPPQYNDTSELRAAIVGSRMNEHKFDLQFTTTARKSK